MPSVFVAAVTFIFIVYCDKASADDATSDLVVGDSTSSVRQYGYQTSYLLSYPSQLNAPIFRQPLPLRRRRPYRSGRRTAPPQQAGGSEGDFLAIILLAVLSQRMLTPPTTATTSTTTMTATTSTTTMTATTATTTISDAITTTTRTTTTSVCVVDWGVWTTCNLSGYQYRSRECPTGTETEQRDCTIDCLQWTDWTTCPIEYVDEKRTRNRQCQTGYESQTENCHSSRMIGPTSDGWYRNTFGYEYKYFAIPKSWILAAEFCKAANPRATLASVGPRVGFLGCCIDKTALNIVSPGYYWIGGTDAASEGTYIFPDNVFEHEDSIDWVGSEPTRTGEHCLIWHDQSNMGIGDNACDEEWPYLCERPVA